MNSSRDEMIKSLKDVVIPKLKELGFKGSFPYYRRITAEKINLLTFQFDKWGGGFVIEISNSNPEGYETHWGDFIKPENLTAHDLSKRKRIQNVMKSNDESLTEDWFRYDKKVLFGNIYKKVCAQVLKKIPIAEEYWSYGEIN